MERGVVADWATSGLQGLDPVEQTLLIPLLARAWGDRWNLDDHQPDASAQEALSQLGWRESTWMPDPVTVGFILWRTRQFRAWAQTYFEQHPAAWGVNLGAGLSDYFQWLSNGRNRWIDADQACVMHLRSRCMSPRPRAAVVSLDVCEDNWWNRIEQRIGSQPGPGWIMLEGVLLYLTADQVHRLLATVAQRAPAGSSLAFDVIPRWMVGWPIRMPVGGTPCAAFQWGVDSLAELEAVDARLHLERVDSSRLSAWSWPWESPSGWNPLSPYSLVQMSVS
jgi:O-methyltransferase involved in polyketide biosynthesis